MFVAPERRLTLNLPLAAGVARRLATHLHDHHAAPEESAAIRCADQLCRHLLPWRAQAGRPNQAEEILAGIDALAIARLLSDAISEESLQDEVLGRYVRNLFEALERAEEGNWQGLLAGEDPNSIHRP